MHQGLDLIGWWFSSHYRWDKVFVQNHIVDRRGPNSLVRTQLRHGYCDLGAVMVNADLLRRHSNASRPACSRFVDCHEWRSADGRLVDRLVRHAQLNVKVLENILYFHQ